MTEFDLDRGGYPNVSRETLDRLNTYADLVKKWSPRINLVSKGSLGDLWARHFLDSVQVFQAVEPANHWVDLGSGGGFPGAVVAILAKEAAPQMRVTLIESDQRKSVFLRTVARELGVPFEVLTDRIETAPRQNCDILSARALADLETLLGYTQRHMAPSGIALFLKGASWEKEIRDAQRTWRFGVESIESQTERAAAILKITGVSRV